MSTHADEYGAVLRFPRREDWRVYRRRHRWFATASYEMEPGEWEEIVHVSADTRTGLRWGMWRAGRAVRREIRRQINEMTVETTTEAPDATD